MFGCVLEPFLVKRVRLVEIVDLGQVRIGEDLRKDAPLRPLPWDDLAILTSDPAAFPAVLIFPVLGIADAGLCLDVVEPDVFHAFAVGPDVLAGDRAGVAPDALVEVEHHVELCADLHSASSFFAPVPQSAVPPATLARSEERRAGHECYS